jgi:kynureninase
MATRSIEDELWELAKAAPAPFATLAEPEFAAFMDERDELKGFRDHFIFPKCHGVAEGDTTTYLCGNSLGLQPKKTRELVVAQLDKWGAEAVEGHFSGSTPWLDIDDMVVESMAKVVGAKTDEVIPGKER